MLTKRIIKRILKYSTVTVFNNSVILDKYTMDEIDISHKKYSIFILIDKRVLELHSGDFETGETHYRLINRGTFIQNINYFSLIVNEKLKNQAKIYNPILEELLIEAERYQKLNKLKNFNI